MPTLNINGNVLVNTVANWTTDVTVYSAKTILISSDATYTGVDQRKFKIADGVQTWANLDYMPIDARALSEILDVGNQANQDIDMNSNSIQNVSFLGTGNSIIDMGGGSYIDITTDAGVHVTPNIFLDAVADTVDLNATSVMKNGNEVATESYVGSYSQPLDSDLTAIAGLTPTNDDILQRKSGSWTNRTMAQLRADLGDYFAINLIPRALSPADSTTYYFSFDIIPTLTASNSTFKLGYNSTLVGAIITASNNTIQGSNESGFIYLRNETSATSSLISNSVKTNATTTQQVTQTVTGLNISVASTDDITIQFDSPAYATNPTAFVFRITLIFSRS